MIGAIVFDDVVTNLIVLNEGQLFEMSMALNCEIVDARPYGLTIGDLRTPAGWTRNAGGEQMILPLLEQEQYDSYTVMANRAVEAEKNAEAAEELGADEILTILEGVDA